VLRFIGTCTSQFATHTHNGSTQQVYPMVPEYAFAAHAPGSQVGKEASNASCPSHPCILQSALDVVERCSIYIGRALVGLLAKLRFGKVLLRFAVVANTADDEAAIVQRAFLFLF
jgi:hypothetical protein